MQIFALFARGFPSAFRFFLCERKTVKKKEYLPRRFCGFLRGGPPNVMLYMKDRDLFIEDLKSLIAAKSVQAPPEPGAPFGAGVALALERFLAVAGRMGFKTVNHEGYLGEIECGEGEEYGVIGHLDVVPAGDGWESDPFCLTEKDGNFYGRGTTDDKGPTLLCLYALNEIKNAAPLRRKVRFFVGCNEENGWADVEYFKNKGGKFPKYGFSPDGDFPVVYAEKGPNRVIFEIPYSGAFCKIRGGEAVNAVCAYACAEGELRADLLKKHGLSGKDGKIESFGKSAHGSYPELGKNAILPLLGYLKDCGENVEGLLRVFADKTISSVGNETGSATLSPNVIAQKDGKLLLTADFRVPAKMRAEEFFPLFDALGVKYTFIKGRDPLYVPKNSEYVQKLAAAYNAVTGENAQPISQRGATFASVFENGTAFGPEFAGEDCRIHAPNEFVPAKNLEKMYAIYLAGLKSIVL